MLIYNFEKKFIGIGEHDLSALGFSSLKELTEESPDFADMFVKKPGFIHNFQHVHWIDFITCSDEEQTTKVIIQAKGKEFQCNLDISTAYLAEQQDAKAFFINIINIKKLFADDNEEEITIVQEVPTQETVTTNEKEIISPDIPDREEAETNTTPNNEYQEDILNLDFKEEVVPPPSIELEEIPEPEEKIKLEITKEEPKKTPAKAPSLKVEKVQKSPKQATTTQVFDNGYIYDSNIASDELGLPVDLIEEFIEDFIAQAKEFKTKLYTALQGSNTNELKSLSHKLKGVAANLRVEDALESLTIINTSSDDADIKTNLDTFYKIISKLSGEAIEVQAPTKKVKPAVQKKKEVKKVQEQIIEIDDSDIFTKKAEPKTQKEPKKKDLEIEDLDIFAPSLATAEKKQAKEPIIEVEDLDIFTPELEVIKKAPKKEAQNTITYNKNKVAKDIGITTEDFQELFEEYLLEVKQILPSIHTAIEASNFALMKKKVLMLKGMNSNMRMDECEQEIKTLLATRDKTKAMELFNSIRNKIKRISQVKD